MCVDGSEPVFVTRYDSGSLSSDGQIWIRQSQWNTRFMEFQRIIEDLVPGRVCKRLRNAHLSGRKWIWFLGMYASASKSDPWAYVSVLVLCLSKQAPQKRRPKAERSNMDLFA